MRGLAVLSIVLMVAVPVQAGDLGLAGALSGAGQSLQQGMATIQAGLIQQELMREQHRLEMERLDREEHRLRERESAARHETQAQRKTTAEPRASAEARMAELEPDWLRIIGPAGSQTPFRQWLARQTSDYRETVENTEDPVVLAGAIRIFKAQTGE